MMPRTCVAPSGRFVYGVHQPAFRADNFREEDPIARLGEDPEGRPVENRVNFPPGAVEEARADRIFEIPNAFPFRGATYIAKSWADEKAEDPTRIQLPDKPTASFSRVARMWLKDAGSQTADPGPLLSDLPEPLALALAVTSDDPEDLTRLAESCCEFVRDPDTGRPAGLTYARDKKGRLRPAISNMALFEAVANNRFLPLDYREVMVLRPGAQGGSEIVGEWRDKQSGSHVFEYLRRNSYIPWGHYAANMAHDAARYRIRDLTLSDMTGMRRLYYQRTFTRLAREAGAPPPGERRMLTGAELETLRVRTLEALASRETPLSFNSALWGWNLGFDFSPTQYRLNASHQQIHQQFALIPPSAPTLFAGAGDETAAPEIPTFACGDLIADFIADYRKRAGAPFFDAYIKAIRTNRRMDGDQSRESRLTIYEDDRVMLFAPKAQTSQWEIQLMVLPPVGNILEADPETRASLDRAMLVAMKALTAMGARMINTIEYSKRFDSPDRDQRLLYAFLPKIPISPGGFSEAQLRWIIGHYPEDFAAACRARLPADPLT
ncbi:MAG: hypothetical protein GY859_10045 [Desulfobacterales bacterium]|nr:hypothetical protein [Desulfobacterales bacterium]